MRSSWILLTVLGICSSVLAGEPIRLHPENGHYFLWRGRPTVLITSTEHYGAVLNLDFDFVTYLDTLQKDGLNHTRTFSGTYREYQTSFGITDNTLAPKHYCSPWLESGGKFDLTKYNEAYFERLKKFLTEAGKRGICAEYTLFCPFYDEGLWDINPMNPKNNVNQTPNVSRMEIYTLKHKEYLAIQDAFVRKAVTELNSFDNVYFEICNEPYFGGVMEDWQAHIAQTIIQTEKDVPSKHLISQNIQNHAKKIDKPDPLVSIFNFHYATPPDTMEQNYGLGKVIGDDETGFRGKEDWLYRTEAWEFLMAGGGEYANLDYSFTTSHPEGSFRDYKSPGGGSPELRKQLAILKHFMEEMDFVHMAPATGIIQGGVITAHLQGSKTGPANAHATVRCLAKPGDTYALYVLGGTQVTLDLGLGDGSWEARWLDTKTGSQSKAELARDGASWKVSSPKYERDIALRIKRRL